VELNNGKSGSLTIGGTVSPAGGNFEEPVTQATLKVVGAFLGLSRDRANARRFPSIHPLRAGQNTEALLILVRLLQHVICYSAEMMLAR
jgi:V/A-type H+-transporting ATPase subunit A